MLNNVYPPIMGPIQGPTGGADEDSGGGLPLVPVVRASRITVTQPDGITVQWDRPMMMTCDAKAQITVLADGNPVVVHSIAFHPTDKSIMGIIVGGDFTAGQVVTWAYDDSGACDIQEIDPPQTEADNQTYAVNNALPAPFITTWRTTAADEPITFPADAETVNRYDVDWGDGTPVEKDLSGIHSHVYAVPGDYDISVTGTLNGFVVAAAEKLKIIDIKQWGVTKVSSYLSAFAGCSNLDISATDKPDLSNTGYIRYMFQNCISLTHVDFSGCDLSKITLIEGICMGCLELLSFSIAGTRVSTSQQVRQLFKGCSKLTQVDLGDFDFSKTASMSELFNGCEALTDIKGIETAVFPNNTNLSSMFRDCLSLRHFPIAGWDISHIATFIAFATNCHIPLAEYDAILLAWSQQTVLPITVHGVDFGATTKYSASSQAARDILTSAPNNWKIIDGGVDASTVKATTTPAPAPEGTQYKTADGQPFVTSDNENFRVKL